MNKNRNFGICGSFRKIVGIEGCYKPPENKEELKVGNYDLDQDFYYFCRNEYIKNGCWTWGFDSIKKCNLYKI